MDSEDLAVAWGIAGGALLAVLNWQVTHDGVKMTSEDAFKFLTFYGATGAVGGLLGGMLFGEYWSPMLAGIMGGVLGSWFLVVTALNY